MKFIDYAFFAALCWGISINALQAQNEGDITPESIDIVKPYEPILGDAARVELSPDLPSLDDLAKEKPVFNDYYITPKFLTIKYTPVELKPIGYDDSNKKKKGDDGEKCRYVWLRGGYGNLKTPLADIALSTCRTKKWIAGLNASYIGSQGPIEFQDYNRLGGRAFGKIYTNQYYVGIDAGYQRNTYYQYGFTHADTSLQFTADELRRRYETISARATLGNSAENDQVIDYTAALNYQTMGDNRNSREHYIDLQGDISGLLNENWAWGLQLRDEFSSLNRPDSNTYSNNLLQASPTVTYKANFGNFTAGATAILDGGKFYPFPKIALEVFVLPKSLTLYGGWNKEASKNTYQSLANQNPFIEQSTELRNSIRENRYLGIKGALGKVLSYNAKGFYNIVKNQALFVNIATPFDADNGISRLMTTVYDPRMSEIGASLEIAARLTDIATISLTTTYASRNTDTETEAWHLPTLLSNLRADVQPIKKLQLTVDAYLINGMKARVTNDTPDNSYTIPTAFDLNVAARFDIIDNIGVFVTANNLLAQKYDRFFYYPVYGLNIVGGITCRF